MFCLKHSKGKWLVVERLRRRRKMKATRKKPKLKLKPISTKKPKMGHKPGRASTSTSFLSHPRILAARKISSSMALTRKNRLRMENYRRGFFTDISIKFGTTEDEDPGLSPGSIFKRLKDQLRKVPLKISIPSKKCPTFDKLDSFVTNTPDYISLIIEIEEDVSVNSRALLLTNRSNFTIQRAEPFDPKSENPVVHLERLSIVGCKNFTLRNVTFKGFSQSDPFILIVRDSYGAISRCQVQGEVEIRDCFHVRNPLRIYQSEIACGLSVGLFIESSFVDICGNSIHHHQSNGINVGSSEGRVSYNRVYRNVDPGIFVKDGTDIHFERNKIYYNQSNGINIANESTSLFVRNEIYGNSDPGIYVKENSCPKVIRNVIRDNQSNAINVDSASGIFERNVFYGNENPVFYVKNNSTDIVIRANNIQGNPTNAIVMENSQALIEHNTIEDSTEVAIYLQNSKVDCIANKLSGNEGIGIYLTEKGEGYFKNNVIQNQTSSAFSIDSDSSACIYGNVIRNVREGNAILMEKASANIENNTIGCVKFPAVFVSHGQFLIQDNDFEENSDVCIYSSYSEGKICMESNSFFNQPHIKASKVFIEPESQESFLSGKYLMIVK